MPWKHNVESVLTATFKYIKPSKFLWLLRKHNLISKAIVPEGSSFEALELFLHVYFKFTGIKQFLEVFGMHVLTACTAFACRPAISWR